MNLYEVRELARTYTDWLERAMSEDALAVPCHDDVRTGGYRNWCIPTPFLDRHNDGIEIYVEQKDDGSLVLHDAGETVEDIRMCGYDVDDGAVGMLARRWGVTYRATVPEGLGAWCVPQDFPRTFHAMIQAIMAINAKFGGDSE